MFVISQEPVLMRDRLGSESGWEGRWKNLRDIEREETIIRMCCVKKKQFSTKRKRKRNTKLTEEEGRRKKGNVSIKVWRSSNQLCIVVFSLNITQDNLSILLKSIYCNVQYFSILKLT